MRMLLLLFSTGAWASGAHDGVVRARTAPELSDLALFAMAVVGVVLARRAMRARWRRRD